MVRKKQQWKIGDVFIVAASDGKLSVGQIIGREAEVLNSVSIALFGERYENETDARRIDLKQARPIAILFVTRDLLDIGKWKIIQHEGVAIPRKLFPHEDLRSSGFVGAEVFGSGIVVKFLEAYHRLAAWDDFHDPNFLDSMLLSPSLKPKDLIYKKSSS